MSLQLKKKFKENLDLIPVYIEDTSLTSEAYFGIKEFPSFFGRGKNGVRVKPNRVTLKPNSQLYIEILDVNLNSVYYEIPDYEPGDLSRYISVWVYGERDDMYNTPNGIGEMIICGIAERTEDGEIIPEEFRDVINVRWRRKISISRDTRSESPIIFSQTQTLQPTLLISESLSFFTETNVPKVTKTINENITYTSDTNGQNVFLETPGSTPTSFIEPEWLNSGVIKFNLQNVTLLPAITSAENDAGILKPIRYSASLQSLVSNKKVRVSNPLTGSNLAQTAVKTFTGFTTTSFHVEYIDPGSAASTIPISFAHITIDNINPIIGNIDKINVYAKSLSANASNTQYRLIGTKILNEPISSSVTDIYYNTTGNLTSSKFTFPFPALKENDQTDIKVEFVNILNDTSEFILNKQQNFVGYNPGGGGSSVKYVSGSLPTINSIRIDDNDAEVSVSFDNSNGRLTLSFGNPTPMGTPTITTTSPFNTDRFNKETQTYSVTGNFAVIPVLNSYIYVVTASLFTGSVLLATTSNPSARSVQIASITTSGSQSYRLQLTASRESGLFTSEYIQSRSITFDGTVSKNPPSQPTHEDPSYRPTLTIQNNLRTSAGGANFKIEQHATGSLRFGYITGSGNRWEYIPNSLTASINGGNPSTTIEYKGNNIHGNYLTLMWTGSMTGSSPVNLQANAFYRSPAGLNDPQRFERPLSDLVTFNKIKSIRWGMFPTHTGNRITPTELIQASASIITNLGLWSLGTTLEPTRSINFETTNFVGSPYIFRGLDSAHFIIVCDDTVSINQVKDSGNNIVDTFSTQAGVNNTDNYTSSGGYKIYLSRTLQTPTTAGTTLIIS